MVDSPTPVEVVPATPKKSPKAKKEKKTAGKSKAKAATHPPTAVMVNAAVKELKERGGSSLQAIKKYIASTYKVDAEKMAPFIRKAVKNSVASGAFVQTKGTGASGSFKIAGAEKGKKPATKPKVTKRKVAAKTAAAPKSPAAKKVSKPKKSPAKKPAAKPKSPAKPKARKAPAKKAKSPTAKATKKSPRKK